MNNEANGHFYDALGQVKAGRKYWPDGTVVMGQQFEYTHDDIGNRRAAKAGGDASGANLRSASYTPNLLNQYTSRTVPGAVDVMGVSLSASATVNSQTPDRKGEYFRKELSVVNTSVPVWQAVTVTAPGETQVDRHEFVAKTPEQFGYDADGNLTSDGRWNYTWDAENRLIRMVANTAVGPQQRIDFEYDWQSRRIAKKVWNNTGGTGDPAVNLKFIYDGWNVLATLNPQLSTLNTFLWGLDLSGSLQGAGGVGGLLAVWDRSTIGGQPSTHFTCYDGNGNVAALLQASSSTLFASYEYGPFGEVIRAMGPMAKTNPFRFSTKYQDDETDLVYYGLRYIRPSAGGWLSRDPIEERRRENLYGFVRNDPVSVVDCLGLEDEPIVWPPQPRKPLMPSPVQPTDPVIIPPVPGGVDQELEECQCYCGKLVAQGDAIIEMPRGQKYTKRLCAYDPADPASDACPGQLGKNNPGYPLAKQLYLTSQWIYEISTHEQCPKKLRCGLPLNGPLFKGIKKCCPTNHNIEVPAGGSIRG